MSLGYVASKEIKTHEEAQDAKITAAVDLTKIEGYDLTKTMTLKISGGKIQWVQDSDL